jgi:large repetitive protein
MELRYDQNEETTIIVKLNDLGAGWVREEFNWNVLEPSQGNFDWSGYDRTMQEYKNAGINVLGVLAYSADWASTAPDTASFRDKYAPQDVAWSSFVAAVVSHYPDIQYWEVWNEPNYANFLISDNQPATYKTILQTASLAIRATNPQAKVVLGGLSGADADFLKKLYAYGAKGLFDIVAVHPYRTMSGQTIYAPEVTKFGLNSLTTDMHIMRSMIHAYEPKNPPPIWITEIGWPTGSTGVSEANQANYLQRAFIISKTFPEVQKIFWYNLRDDSSTDQEDKFFGLYAYDWRAKPAATAIKQLAANYPTLTVKEDLEAFSKTVEEFNNLDHISVEVFDNGKFIRRDQVTKQPAIHAALSKGSVNYKYEFAKNKTIQYRRIAIKGAPKYWFESFDLWLWSDGGIHPVRIRMKDATGEIFQGNAGSTGYGWTHLAISLNSGGDNFVSWGGDNDKKVDYPVTLDSVILEKNPDSPIMKGNIVLSRFTYRRFDQAFSYHFMQDAANNWVYWKASGKSKIVTANAPVVRLMSTTRWNGTSNKTLQPAEINKKKIITFGLSEQPLFVK